MILRWHVPVNLFHETLITRLGTPIPIGFTDCQERLLEKQLFVSKLY